MCHTFTSFSFALGNPATTKVCVPAMNAIFIHSFFDVAFFFFFARLNRKGDGVILIVLFCSDCKLKGSNLFNGWLWQWVMFVSLSGFYSLSWFFLLPHAKNSLASTATRNTKFNQSEK